jgi:peptide chain release factor subunit 1
MIATAEVKRLVQRPSTPGSPVLSVYLDVDQSKAANLRRGFEAALKNMLRPLGDERADDRQHEFSKDSERVERFVMAFEPRGKGLIIFCDDSEDFFWTRSLRVDVHNAAKWNATPFILPLIGLIDEYERYAIALVDQQHARLFTAFMGEIEEHRELAAPAEVRHIKATGTDQLLSQKQFHRKADVHARLHLKNVAEALDAWLDQYGFDRLVLAGPVEATSGLYHLLSKRLRTRVAGRNPLAIDASESVVLEQTLTVERQAEREMEKQLVHDLLAADTQHPVTRGLDGTLGALHEERIWRLLYATGLHPAGGQCSYCQTLTVKSNGACDYCNAPVRQVDDLMELVVERVLATDGKVEEVMGEASIMLRNGAEGMGAMLRF